MDYGLRGQDGEVGHGIKHAGSGGRDDLERHDGPHAGVLIEDGPAADPRAHEHKPGPEGRPVPVHLGDDYSGTDAGGSENE